MSWVNTTFPTPFPVAREDFRKEVVMPSVSPNQSSEAARQAGGGGGAWDGELAVSPHSTFVYTWLHPGIYPVTPGRRLPLLPGLRKQERVVRGSSREVCQAVVVSQHPGRMGSVWGLAVPLLFFCWKAGVAVVSPGKGHPDPGGGGPP